MKEFNVKGMYPSKNEVLEFNTSSTQVIDEDGVATFTPKYIYFATSMGNLITKNLSERYFRCVVVKDDLVLSDSYEYFMSMVKADKYENGRELINFLVKDGINFNIKVYNISNRKGFMLRLATPVMGEYQCYILPCSKATHSKHVKLLESKKKVESFVSNHK